MDTKLIMPLVLFAFGNIITLHVILSYLWQTNYWVPVHGVIVKVVEDSLGDTTVESPKISYEYNGQNFVEFLRGWKSTVYLSEGADITVLVNPENPKKFSIKSWHNVVGPSIFLVILNTLALKTVIDLKIM